MKKLNRKGFSLVELIIVIAIMAVLIGLLAPQYLKYVEKTRIQKTISDASTVCNAIIAMITDSAAHNDDLYKIIEEEIVNNNSPYTVDLTSATGDAKKIADAINSTAGGKLDGEVTFYLNDEYTPSFSYTMDGDKYSVDYQAPAGYRHVYIVEDGKYGAYLTADRLNYVSED